MVRYKRRKSRYSGTRAIKMKFQSFMDISTSDSSMQVITVSAGGKEILERCPAQFAAYKYYKLGSISVKLVPASTLPVDPTGLSYEVGEQTVDPRDQLTPGLMRITNGEDIMENITGMSDEQQHGIYNNMLLDPRWFKWMLQSGVKRYASPRYWQIGQLHQDKWPGMIFNVPMVSSEGGLLGTATFAQDHVQNSGELNIQPIAGQSSPYGLFQTGHIGKLGWMPTDGLQPIVGVSGLSQLPLLASPPEVEVMKIILPKAYKTKYYYRMFVTQTVYFKEPIVTMSMPNVLRPLDVFHGINAPTPQMPNDPDALYYPFTGDQTGGNYGNN